MDRNSRFGHRVRKLRRQLDLTQEELARRVGCAAITVRKIEAGDLRPSKQISELLARALSIPLEAQTDFVRQARAVQPGGSDSLPTPTPQVIPEEIGTSDLSGRAIRGYLLGERIGVGGFGAVYRAVQPLVEREVAIKIILPEYANHPDFIRRFEAEAQVVARLEHPHIVPLYDYWREPGVAYLVMRLLRGGSVQDRLDHGPLPLETVAKIVDQVGSALQAAHRLGVVHRDLKPANILLDETGNAYLADFGIAKSFSNWEIETKVGSFIGSPAYSSPEQIRSEPIKPQADIYGLGVLLFELLTGERPFTGPTPLELAQQHLSDPMPPLASRRSGMPAAMDAVIARATAKDPLERYADVGMLAADVGRIAETGRLDRRAAATVAMTEIVNPYKGLRAFGEADAADFYGRETLTQQLLARLSEGGDLSRFLAVVGPSGSGKSSVVRAGLIPALRRGALPGSEDWFIVDFIPGPEPFHELAAALQRVAVGSFDSTLSNASKDPRGLLRAVREALPQDEATELVIIIDQFEEVFTLVADLAERSRFLDILVTAVLDEGSRTRVVITLRADFIDRPLRYADFGELIKHRSELVLPLTADEMEHAVRGPAERIGLRVEPELVAAVIGDVTDQPGALPLMQYALTEAFESCQDGVLALAGYQALGGVHGALAKRADEVYLSLQGEERTAAREMFLRLVTLGEGTEDTRRRVLRSELEELGSDAGAGNHPSGDAIRSPAMDNVIRGFGQARLLTFDRDPSTRQPTVEVGHEALLREWPRLGVWLDDSRADVRLQRLLSSAAHEWNDNQRDPSYLLSGARLDQFNLWGRTKRIALTRDEQVYLDASREEQSRQAKAEAARQDREVALERRSTGFLRALAGVLGLAAIGAFILSGFAFRQRGIALENANARATAQVQAEAAQAEAEGEAAAKSTAEAEAESQRGQALVQASIGLASQAELELDGGFPERSVLLALEALENYPYTWQAERALGNAVMANRLKGSLVHDSLVGSTRWSPDGHFIATASDDGSARIWDVATGETVVSLEHDGEVFLAEWSPSGDRLLTRSSDGFARVWNSSSGELLLTLRTSEQFGVVEWGPTGDQILAFDFDGEVKLWNAWTGELLLTSPDETACTDVRCTFVEVLSPSGNRLLGTSSDGAIEVRDAKTGESLARLDVPWQSLESLRWSPDGSRVLATGDGRYAGVWDSHSGGLITLLSGHTDEINCASWAPGGDRILTTSNDATAKVWDATSGEVIANFDGHPIFVLGCAWSPDGELVATGGFDGDIMVWSPVTGQLTEKLSGHSADVNSIEWSNSGDRIASSDGNGVVKIWALAAPNLLYEIPGAPASGWEVEWSPDGSQLARGQNDGTARIYDASTRAELFFLDMHGGTPVGDIEWSPDGTLIYTLSAWENGSADVWDAYTGNLLSTLSDPSGWLSYSSWAPDGSEIATASMAFGQLEIWDPTTGQVISEFDADIPNAIAAKWSPDGTRIALAGDGGVTIFGAETGQELSRLYPNDIADEFVTWSPDGFRLAAHGEEGLRIWNSDGELIASNNTHGSLIFSIDWFPTGDRIVAFDKKGSVKVWDTSTGAELLSFQMPLTGNSALSPDGRELALAQNPGGPIDVFWIWQSEEELIDFARQCCVFRQLTTEERELFGLPPLESSNPTP